MKSGTWEADRQPTAVTTYFDTVLSPAAVVVVHVCDSSSQAMEATSVLKRKASRIPILSATKFAYSRISGWVAQRSDQVHSCWMSSSKE